MLTKKTFHNKTYCKKTLLLKLLTISRNSWQNFIFSDESRLELYSKRRQYVQRPVGQRFKSKHTLKTVKYGGPSILVWEAIRGDITKV